MTATLRKGTPRNALGRGLKALVSLVPAEVQAPQLLQDQTLVDAAPSVKDAEIRSLPVDKVHPNPDQPRKFFNPEELADLTSSIRTHGLLQPVLVRPRGESYEIIAGERRWRAAKEAQLTEIPVIIKDLSERETLQVALVENLQRSQLSSIEEAKGFRLLMMEFDLTQEEVAEAVGKNRATVANALRLLKLPAEIHTLLENGRLPLGHAKVILSVRDEVAQLNLAMKVVDDGLSVRELENMVARARVLDSRETIPAGKRPRSTSPRGAPAYMAEVVDRLRNALGTKVRLATREGGRGTIEIDYFSEAELDGLVERIARLD